MILNVPKCNWHIFSQIFFHCKMSSLYACIVQDIPLCKILHQEKILQNIKCYNIAIIAIMHFCKLPIIQYFFLEMIIILLFITLFTISDMRSVSYCNPLLASHTSAKFVCNTWLWLGH